MYVSASCNATDMTRMTLSGTHTSVNGKITNNSVVQSSSS